MAEGASDSGLPLPLRAAGAAALGRLRHEWRGAALHRFSLEHPRAGGFAPRPATCAPPTQPSRMR